MQSTRAQILKTKVISRTTSNGTVLRVQQGRLARGATAPFFGLAKIMLPNGAEHQVYVPKRYGLTEIPRDVKRGGINGGIPRQPTDADEP